MPKTASSEKVNKQPVSTEAAERLVQEITHSIAQRSVAARRKRKHAPQNQEVQSISDAASKSLPVQQEATKPAPAPAPAPAVVSVPVTSPAPVETPKAQVEEAAATRPAEPVYVAKVEPPAPVMARTLSTFNDDVRETPRPVEKPLETYTPLSVAPIVAPYAGAAPIISEEPVRETFRDADIPVENKEVRHLPECHKLAIFFFDEPVSAIGSYIAGSAAALAKLGVPIQLFTRLPFPSELAGLNVHVVGDEANDNFLERVRAFGRRAVAAFNANIANVSDTALMGHEWSTIPALSELARQHNSTVILSIDSLETQRSDMSSPISREIQKIEAEGLRLAATVLLRKQETHVHATQLAPECAEKLAHAHLPFVTRPYQAEFDAGAVKARFQVGPVDPTIVFIGDFDERHGPDVLMKAIPPILKNHKQTHFIFVGDGVLQWPLRVHARYLLLENSVRLPGHISGDALLDLIQAADIVCVPSRSRTEEWPILAAWAAHRPVLTTHAMAVGSKLLEHEVNSVLAYANENSMVWGVERLLFDASLRARLGDNGAKTLEKRFGWDSAAEQIAGLMKRSAHAK